jgi:3-oxoacyl-[acyl-carrier protein] reductase
MELSLKGKRAVVCGSTQGIGKGIALELALLGADVLLLARNEQTLKATVAELAVAGGQQHDYRVVDFTNPEQVKLVINKYVREHPVHILINNTGGPSPGLAIDSSPELFVEAFNSHLICNQILVQATVPSMKLSGYGRIINVISTSVKMPMRGLGVSNTIRGAVASWAKTLSMELGPFGITVNNVLPGAIETSRHQAVVTSRAEKSGRTEEEVLKEMKSEIPLGRIGTIHEIGAVAAFLASPAAGYVSGINVPVDGGRTGTL